MAIKFNKNKTNNNQTKCEYMQEVYDYAADKGMYEVCDLLDDLVDDGFNQVYNIVANESDILCINYDFNENQIPEVAKYISDNIDDITLCVESAGNIEYIGDVDVIADEGDECDCSDCHKDCHEDCKNKYDGTQATTSKVDTLTSLIGEVCNLIKKNINAKSDLEKAQVIMETNSIADKVLKFVL